MKTYLFNHWKQEDQQNQVIRILRAVILLLVLLNGGLFVGWQTAPQRMRVFLPPQLGQGVWTKPNAIPRTTVYAFAYEIFTAITTWGAGKQQDYHSHLRAYRHYLSPTFLHTLQADYQQRAARGALERERLVTGISGMGYSADKVVPLGNGLWHVTLRLHIVETLAGGVVKDVIIHYPLTVAKVNAAVTVNPWGLVLQGFYQAPQRIKTAI